MKVRKKILVSICMSVAIVSIIGVGLILIQSRKVNIELKVETGLAVPGLALLHNLQRYEVGTIEGSYNSNANWSQELSYTIGDTLKILQNEKELMDFTESMVKAMETQRVKSVLIHLSKAGIYKMYRYKND